MEQTKKKMNDNANSIYLVVNLDYLITLSKGNTEFVKEMIGIFIEENPEEMQLLEKGIQEKDFALIFSSAHKLKSAMPFVGLDKIIEKEISEMEKLASEKSDILKIKLLFSKVKINCEKACQELKQL